jgi:hypothetical protein
MKRETSKHSESNNDTTTPLLATSTISSDIQADPLTSSSSMSINHRTQLKIHAPFISSSLLLKLAGDVFVGCTVALGISPVLTVIDKAIVQKAAGTHGVLQSSWNSFGNLVKNPVQYFRSPMFLLMWGVYASTYCTGKWICLGGKALDIVKGMCVFVRTFSILFIFQPQMSNFQLFYFCT